MTVSFLFEPRDLWVGVYWDRRPTEFSNWPKGARPELERLSLWVCLLPTLVIRVRL